MTDDYNEVEEQEIKDMENLEPPEVEDEYEPSTEGEQETQKGSLTPEEFNQILDRRLARLKKSNEKRLTQLFGTTNLETAAQYYQAGQAVAKASGKSPQEITQKVAGQGQSTPEDAESNLAKELQEVKDMLMSKHDQERITKQEAEAQKEFGEFYTEHREDIHEMAEDRGLTLADAAAVVLRPKLGELYEKRMRTKQTAKRKKIEGSGEAPATKGQIDYASKLSSEQKRIAQKWGLSLKEYYDNMTE